MSRIAGPSLPAAFRRAAVPLAWYYVVALGLPLANGAAQSQPAFFDHALVVVLVPPILIALVAAILSAIARVVIRYQRCGSHLRSLLSWFCRPPRRPLPRPLRP
jgi:hypothetical protein